MSSKRYTLMDQIRLTAGGPTSTTPALVGKTGIGGERIKEGRPILVEIDRARDGTTGALDGTIAVWGANLHNSYAGAALRSQVQAFQAADAGTQTDFDPTLADMPYAAFANYNWIVIQDGNVLTQGAGAGKFTVTNPGTTQARIVLGTAAPAKSRVVVHFVTPVAVVADGANEIVRAEVTGKTVLWVVGTHASSNLSRTLAAISALN
jgi:hypothetical protein